MPLDLSNLYISRSFQRVLQISDADNRTILDGTGSYHELDFSGSFSGSFRGDGSGLTGYATNFSASWAHTALSASHEIIKEISSSHANYADNAGTASFALTAAGISGGDLWYDGGTYISSSRTVIITGSLNISASSDVTKGILVNKAVGIGPPFIKGSVPDANLHISSSADSIIIIESSEQAAVLRLRGGTAGGATNAFIDFEEDGGDQRWIAGLYGTGDRFIISSASLFSNTGAHALTIDRSTLGVNIPYTASATWFSSSITANIHPLTASWAANAISASHASTAGGLATGNLWYDGGTYMSASNEVQITGSLHISGSADSTKFTVIGENGEGRKLILSVTSGSLVLSDGSGSTPGNPYPKYTADGPGILLLTGEGAMRQYIISNESANIHLQTNNTNYKTQIHFHEQENEKMFILGANNNALDQNDHFLIATGSDLDKNSVFKIQRKKGYTGIGTGFAGEDTSPAYMLHVSGGRWGEDLFLVQDDTGHEYLKIVSGSSTSIYDSVHVTGSLVASGSHYVFHVSSSTNTGSVGAAKAFTIVDNTTFPFTSNYLPINRSLATFNILYNSASRNSGLLIENNVRPIYTASRNYIAIGHHVTQSAIFNQGKTTNHFDEMPKIEMGVATDFFGLTISQSITDPTKPYNSHMFLYWGDDDPTHDPFEDKLHLAHQKSGTNRSLKKIMTLTADYSGSGGTHAVTGSVGIGTDDPIAKLDIYDPGYIGLRVDGNTQMTGSLKISGSLIEMTSASGSDALLHIISSGSGDVILKLESDLNNAPGGDADNPRIEFVQDGGVSGSAIFNSNNYLNIANSFDSTSGIDLRTGTSNGWYNAESRLFISSTGNITASGNYSSSAASTASFGTYLGDGSQLSGISPTPFPFVGTAVITGSLIISGSTDKAFDIQSTQTPRLRQGYYSWQGITTSNTLSDTWQTVGSFPYTDYTSKSGRFLVQLYGGSQHRSRLAEIDWNFKHQSGSLGLHSSASFHSVINSYGTNAFPSSSFRVLRDGNMESGSINFYIYVDEEYTIPWITSLGNTDFQFSSSIVGNEASMSLRANDGFRWKQINNGITIDSNNYGYIGIGKTAPTTTLDIEGNTYLTGSLKVTGSFQLVDGLQQNAYVLTSDATGVGTWQVASGGGGGGGLWSGSAADIRTNNGATIGITGSLSISGSTLIKGSGSGIFEVVGSVGTVFSVNDGLTGTLFEANNISGLPVIQAKSDNTVHLGKWGGYGITISGSTPDPSNEAAKISITGSTYYTGSVADFTGVGSIVGLPASDPFPYTGNAVITGSLVVSGSGTYDVGIGTRGSLRNYLHVYSGVAPGQISNYMDDTGITIGPNSGSTPTPVGLFFGNSTGGGFSPVIAGIGYDSTDYGLSIIGHISQSSTNTAVKSISLSARKHIEHEASGEAIELNQIAFEVRNYTSSLLTMYGDGHSRFESPSGSDMVFHIKSKGHGDTILKLETDPEDIPARESDNPRIEFVQDGGKTGSAIYSSDNIFTIANSYQTAGGISLLTGNVTGYTNATESIFIEPLGKVRIRRSADVTGSLSVTGHIAGATKSFLIDHPTKPGYKLQHGSLEGPEHAVYVRGELKDENVIALPEYWGGLVDEDTITVQLTPIGKSCVHYVDEIRDYEVHIRCECDLPHCYYLVQGERKDVDKLKTELE